jgi:hypothetical protein
MKGRPALMLLLLTGCSTAPCADLLDWLCPGRLPPEKTTPYGGVCLPQGVIAPCPTPIVAPVSPGGPVVIPPPPPPPTAGVAPVSWPPRAGTPTSADASGATLLKPAPADPSPPAPVAPDGL